MKYLVLIAVWLCVCMDTYAGKVIEEALEPAVLEIRYERRKVLDTLDAANIFRKDILTLKSGKNVSAFYSAELKTSDSLEYRYPKESREYRKNREARQAHARLPKEKIFRNYPTGKIRVHDRFDLCYWAYDEELEKPEWTVSESDSTIMGYQCFFAETDFRSRHWEVWFTPEIPVSDGPWKLWGLPGVILSARDSKGHYVYTPLSIRSEGIGDVEYYDYTPSQRMKTSREKALTRKWQYIHEDIRALISAMGMHQFKTAPPRKKPLYDNDNYDFEETNYPHIKKGR